MSGVRYEILKSFARTLVAEAYASFCESEQQEGRPTDDLAMPGAGEDWLDYAPEPTPEAVAIAAQAMARIEAHVGMRIEALYEAASAACALSTRRKCDKSTHTPEHFGSDVAMQYVGAGVAWDDDHVTRLDLPYGESGLYSRTDFGLPELAEDDDNTGGYCDCACRDCFDVAIGKSGKALCHACAEAGCEANDGECQRDDAYGVDGEEG